MSCKWMLQMTLATAMTVSLTAPLAAQYQGYPSPSPYNTPAPQRAQLPSWYSPLPPVTQSQPYNAPSQPAAPHAYSPSEMPSVSPFANVRSRDQQTPASYGGTQYQPASQHPPTSQYQPAPQSYYAYPASASDSQQHAVGGGIPNSLPAYSPPAQEMMASPQQHSYYDQPAQNHSSPPDYGFDAKGAGGSSLVGPAMGIRNGWYGGAVGMYMTRSRANNLWLSYDITDIRDRVLNSNDAANSWAGGAGANIGHYFNCGQNSIQFIYWGLYPGVSEANAYGANTASGIDTIMHFDGLQYNPGAGAQDVSNFYFNAERHRVQRNYQLNNIELNLLGHNFTSSCSPLQLGWTAGVRYLRFDESFLYSSDPDDVVFSGAPREVHYAINTQNNLVGVQFGGQANYCIGPRLGLFANTKIGLFGNQMSQHSVIYGSNGQAFVGDPASPYLGQDVDATATRTSYSMVGSLTVGGNWCVSSCWSINAGYQAIGITGVALATNQVPVDFIGALDSIRTVNSNGCVIFHGAFAGATFCF